MQNFVAFSECMNFTILILSRLYVLSEPRPHLKIYIHMYYDVLYCKKFSFYGLNLNPEKESILRTLFLIITSWFFVAFMSSVNRALACKFTITCVVWCFVLSKVYCLETNLFHVFDFVLDSSKHKRCDKVAYTSGTFGLLFTKPINYLSLLATYVSM